MSAELLDEVSRALRVLWVSGTARPDPELQDDLATLADRAQRSGAPQLAKRIRDLQESLGSEREAFEAQVQVWVRTRLLQRGLGVQRLRLQLEAQAEGTEVSVPVLPPGWSGTFLPLGAHVAPPKVQVHGVDEDGNWRTFAEVAVAIDPYDRWSGPWVSRLFQDEVCLSEALTRSWKVTEHPGVQTAERWVGRPAFSRRPKRMKRRVAGVELDALRVGARMGVGRANVQAQRGPNGWTAQSGGQGVPVNDCLSFNLEKASAEEGPSIQRAGVLLAAGPERILLQWGRPPSFPTLDPTAVQWSAEQIRARTSGARGAVVRALLATHAGWPAEEIAPTLRADDAAGRFWMRWAGELVGLSDASAVETVATTAEEQLRCIWHVEPGQPGPWHDWLAARPSSDGELLDTIVRARLLAICEVEGSVRATQILEGELENFLRRSQGGDVLPSLNEVFWLSDSIAWLRGTPRQQGVIALGLPADRLDAALVAPLRRWMASDEGPDDAAVLAWAIATSAQRLDAFVAPG